MSQSRAAFWSVVLAWITLALPLAGSYVATREEAAILRTRLDALEQEVRVLREKSPNYGVIVEQLGALREDVGELKTDVKALREVRRR